MRLILTCGAFVKEQRGPAPAQRPQASPAAGESLKPAPRRSLSDDQTSAAPLPSKSFVLDTSASYSRHMGPMDATRDGSARLSFGSKWPTEQIVHCSTRF